MTKISETEKDHAFIADVSALISHFESDTGLCFDLASNIEVVASLNGDNAGKFYRKYPDGELEEVYPKYVR